MFGPLVQRERDLQRSRLKMLLPRMLKLPVFFRRLLYSRMMRLEHRFMGDQR